MPAGYKIRGIAPYELRGYPDPVKLQFWGWVVDLGIKAKDRDLAEGLDAFGEPLRPITRKTRKYRKSEMTPDGKGDPSAPPLMPGRGLSRTRSLLAGRAFTTHAEFYWRFDPFSGDTWAAILTIHKRKGRDVFGLSEEATDRVRRQALAMWMKWKRQGAVIPLELEGKRVKGLPIGPAPPVTPIGKTDYTHATHGIGVPLPPPARTSGMMTEAQLREAMRAPAPAAIPGRRERAYNLILSHIWGQPGQTTGGGGAVVPLLPPPRPSPLPALPAPVTVKDAEVALGVKFAPNHIARGNRGYTTVVLDVAKVESDLAKDAGQHVGAGGIGAAIKGRYEEFVRFLARAKAKKTPIEQPRATIAVDTGEIAITDGRHRFAVFRDMLARWLPFSVRRSQAKKMKEKYGATK